MQWSLERVVATLFWNLDRQLLIGAVLIHSVRKWITGQHGVIDLAMAELLVNGGSAVIKNLVAGAAGPRAAGRRDHARALRPVLGAGFQPASTCARSPSGSRSARICSRPGRASCATWRIFRAGLSSAAYQAAAG